MRVKVLGLVVAAATLLAVAPTSVGKIKALYR